MNCAAPPTTTTAMMMMMNGKTSAKKTSATPLAASSAENTFCTSGPGNGDHCCSSPGAGEDKENSAESSRSWLSKVCSKLRHKHRHEKCEKCGQRSDTCRPNPSFISGRKHYLCQDCRVSSRNMKTMYQQLCRNLSLRDHSSRTTTCTSGDLSPPASTRGGGGGGGLSRSKSMKVQPTSPESGYETATSLDSSCSERLSADPVSTSSGEGGRCSPLSDLSPPLHHHHHHHHHHGDDRKNAAADHHQCFKDRVEVFGGAFKAEKVHLHHLQQFMTKQRTYVRQCPAAVPQQDVSSKAAHKGHQHAKATATTKQYDGYLEIRTPHSDSVKYVFRKPECGQVSGQCPSQQQHQVQRRRQSGCCEEAKQCYRCERRRSVAFRAPFGKGWLCEDCMDDLM